MTNPSLNNIDHDSDPCGDNNYQWAFTGTVTVSDVWVADGFDLTPTRLQRIIQDAFERELGFSYPGEVATTSEVTSAPDALALRKERGELVG